MNCFGIMKNLLAAGAILLMVGCAPDPRQVAAQGCSTEGLTYENTSVYYNGKARRDARLHVEVALDDGKLVQEATFVLTSYPSTTTSRSTSSS